MIQRMTKLFLAVCILFSGSVAQAPAVKAQQQAEQPAQVRVVRADDEGVLLAVSVPAYQIVVENLEGNAYQTLRLTEGGYTTHAGAPQLPVIGANLGVPADAEISVQVLQADSEALPSTYRLRPAPVAMPGEDDFSPGTLAYLPDAQAYANDQLYPPAIAEVADDAWLRDQRIVSLAIYPFQYQAASGKITWHREILLQVNFENTPTPVAASSSSVGSANAFEPVLQSALLNYDQALAWRTSAAAGAAPSAGLASQALPTRYKIVVDQDGLYRLAYSDILQAGIPTSTPANWRLTNLGDTVAILINGQEDGSFDPGDELLFYGEKFRGGRFAARYPDENSLYWLLDNCANTYCPAQTATYQRNAGLHAEKYTQENVYWLEIENTPQPRWNTQDGTPGSAPLAAYFTDTLRAEENVTWSSSHFTEEDTWFWERYNITFTPAVTLTTRNYQATLPGVANVAFTATVRGDVVAGTGNLSVNPDHRAAFRLNNSPILGAENVEWDGLNRVGFEGQIAQSQLLDGANQLNFTFYGMVPGGNSERMYFNWFEVVYARLFQAVNDELWFNSAAAGDIGFGVSDFSNNQFWALDITRPLTPTLIANVGVSGTAPYTASFEVEQLSEARYYLTTTGALKTPKSVRAYTPPDLRSTANGADYIFITHKNFITPTQELAAYRATQGLRTLVVDIEDVYNTFSDGIFNPMAIKTFLKYAYTHWQGPAPLYVMLVGHGNWDLLGNRATPPPPMYLPPYLVLSDPWQGEVDSSNLLVTLVGDDALPDMLLGRAVVTSEAEMQAMVDKIKAYEAAPPSAWQTNLAFVADNTPDAAGDFVAENEEIIASHVPPGYSITRLYQNNFGCTSTTGTPSQCANMRDAITDTLDITGTLILSYVGHGAATRWSGESILTLAGVPTLNNGAQLPIVLDMTCLTGYFIHPSYPDQFSLAAALVRAENKGAIATFSPTGLGIGTGHSILHAGFFDSVFKNEVRTLGAAALASKINLYVNHYYFDLLNTYTIFGDPALKLPVPLHQPAISTPDGQKDTLPSSSVSYSLTVRNDGSVTDTFTLSAQGNTWGVQLSKTSTKALAPGEGDQLTVTVQTPADAIHGDNDSVNITAKSQANLSKSAQQALTTSVKIQTGIVTSTVSASQSGLPGETLDYTLKITNTGELTDTFSAAINSAWDTALNPASPFSALAPGEGRTFTVSVSIPAAAQNGDFNTSSIDFRSKNNPAVVATVNLLTSANIPSDIVVSPANEAKDGLPGETIAYTIQVTNAGETTDSFNVVISSTWPATLAPGVTLGPIAPNHSQNITLSVTIPATATNGSFSIASLTFRSQNNPDVVAAGNYLTNVHLAAGVALLPASIEKHGTAGSDLVFELEITNTGNMSDTFTIEASGNWPISLAPATPVGPIAPGDKRTLLVHVSIPASAMPGEIDVSTITVSSQRFPAVFARAQLSAQVGGQIYLPLIAR